MNEKKIVLEIKGKEYRVIVSKFTADEAVVRVDGKKYRVGLKDLGIEEIPHVLLAAESIEEEKKTVPERPSLMHKPKSIGIESEITAPLPGQIVKIYVEEGEAIKQGQKVCMLEAMKMENEVNASASGIVIDIKYQEGDSVNQGDVIFLIKPLEK